MTRKAEKALEIRRALSFAGDGFYHDEGGKTLDRIMGVTMIEVRFLGDMGKHSYLIKSERKIVG